MSSTATHATTSELFEPLRLGAITLPNRVVMAPLTRTRAEQGGVPGALMAEYYTQRAGFGLVVTEGTYPSHESQAYVGQPGIANNAQAQGWQKVAESVHRNGGRIVMQLMHGGRTAHPNINGGRRVLGPSPLAAEGEAFTEKGREGYLIPQEMSLEDIDAVIAEFAASARRAIDVGLDGVEVHAANGYLLHQFLAPGSNQRADEYGGGPENRARFVVEVVEAVAAAVGAERVGVRVSPEHNIQGATETDHADVLATYSSVLDHIRPLGLAYLSVVHADPLGDTVQTLREQFGKPLLVNTGFASQTTYHDATRLIQSPLVDAVVVGRAAIANPDLVERWSAGHAENTPRPELFYAFTPEGYTDYPVIERG
ncbi:alkene reductase [Microbacterium sp. NPDC089696]|uniref:alkene reductase n=1 Tax=Microbacterium sp. NPDC089696 TaxID=3364199 RepID=UPI0038241EA3